MITMPGHHTLGIIADLYVPLLGIWIVVLFVSAIRKQPQRARIQINCLLPGLIMVYGLMLLDMFLGIWPRFGMDYSTHTAISLVFVMFLAGFQSRWLIIQLASFVSYLFLMWFQSYHSVVDMVTTAVVVGGLYLPFIIASRRQVISRLS